VDALDERLVLLFVKQIADFETPWSEQYLQILV